MKQSVLKQSRERLAHLGERVTHARIGVLATLLESGSAVTPLEIQSRLASADGASQVDRVTVYRVLDWLTSKGVAHRVAGSDRTVRYSVAGDGGHGHFKCSQCDRIYCLASGAAVGAAIRKVVPEGFSADHVELTVIGLCAQCR